MKTIIIKTSKPEEFINITHEVQNTVKDSGIKNGEVLVFVPHTTAGVTINESADPDVVRDIITQIAKTIPVSADYNHAEGNSHAHIKSSLFGCSQKLIIENGKLILGTWQGIYFCEFDGPRSRLVHINVTGL